MSAVIKEHGNEFKEETWGKKVDGEDVIDGYKVRGRQPFKTAREKLEKLMVRGAKFEVGNIECTVLDVRNKGIEFEVDVQMIGSEKDSRGVAVVKLYGPNKKKENVVLVTKYKQSDIRFVTLMAKNVIKPLIYKFLNIEKEETKEKTENDNKCEFCENVFNTKRGLKGHITKKHREDKTTTKIAVNSTGDTDILLVEKETDDETSLEEDLEIKEEKKYTSKCKECEHSFETTRKYELIKQLKNHKQIHVNQPKYKQKYCSICDFATNSEQHLKRHKRDKHDELSVSTSPPPKKSKVDLKQSEEGMEIDEPNEVEMDIDDIEDDVVIRSKMMDEKIVAKAKKIEEEEKKYQEMKNKEEERKKEKEAMEHQERKLSVKQKKQKIKDEKKKTRKKKETEQNELKDIPNIKPVPNNIAHLCNKGDLLYCVPGDGACGPNSIAAHLFKDEVFGPKLKGKINDFKVKHWHRKYKLKTQCTVESPFIRRIGNRGKISFTDPDKLFEYLKETDEAAFMWTDCEDLIVVADMFQVKIKIITTKGENDENPSVNWIYPDEEMKEFAELKDVKIDDIVLLHENDAHFNLIITEDNELATTGSLSFMTNIGSFLKTREQGENNENGKTFADVVVSGLKAPENSKDEIDRIKEALKKSNDRNKALEKQYEECETALRRSIEESEKLKSELKDLKLLMKIEKEHKSTPSRTPQEEIKFPKLGKEKPSESSKDNFLEEADTEEEFNCLECDYQGTEQSQLNKHIQFKHRIQCRICENFFKNKPEFMVHRKSEHYQTVATCNKGANCEFLERCWWKHKKINAKDIECYFCEETFETKNQVMLHRKSSHAKTVKKCTKFENDSCTKNEETCWFMHLTKNLEKEEPKTFTGNNSVFWKRQDNLKSP